MKKIILHIGHGKTGSSFIQSALALSVDDLHAQGVDYPYAKSFSKALEGRISSGNLHPVDDWHLEIERAAEKSKSNTILFSAEGLFWRPDLVKSITYLKKKGLDVSVVLFTRNPAEHAISAYMQAVQTSGYTGALEKFITEVYAVPSHTAKLLKKFKASSIAYDLRNYSAHKKDLLSEFAKIINISDLTVPPKKVVNRTMTSAEFELQRRFNNYYGPGSAHFVSNELCNELPEIKPEKISFSPKEYEILYSKVKPAVSTVNEMVEESERYILPKVLAGKAQVKKSNNFLFSGEQLSVVAKSISKQLLSSETTVKEVRQAASSAHRVTRKALNGEALNAEDLKLLLVLLENILPNGQLIKSQLQQLDANGIPRKVAQAAVKPVKKVSAQSHAQISVDAEALVVTAILEKFVKRVRLDGDDLMQIVYLLEGLELKDKRILSRITSLKNKMEEVSSVELIPANKLKTIESQFEENVTALAVMRKDVASFEAEALLLRDQLSAAQTALADAQKNEASISQELSAARDMITALKGDVKLFGQREAAVQRQALDLEKVVAEQKKQLTSNKSAKTELAARKADLKKSRENVERAQASLTAIKQDGLSVSDIATKIEKGVLISKSDASALLDLSTKIFPKDKSLASRATALKAALKKSGDESPYCLRTELASQKELSKALEAAKTELKTKKRNLQTAREAVLKLKSEDQKAASAISRESALKAKASKFSDIAKKIQRGTDMELNDAVILLEAVQILSPRDKKVAERLEELAAVTKGSLRSNSSTH